MPTILVTGSSGYIGSHTLLQLFNQRYNVVCIDSGVNSFKNRIYKNLGQIANKKRISRYPLDLSKDLKQLDDVFNNHAIDYCIHFAALKSVSDSISTPLSYYQNNLISTLNLLDCCKKYNVKGMIYSSSATVYSPNQKMPLTEESQVGLNLTNTYAKTKYFCEEIIKDFCQANPDFDAVILRYFNPIGSHNSRLLDENPRGEPKNLMPNILKAMDNEETFNIYGNDYDTKDGTCIRDYIHVEDLAFAHIKALHKIMFHKLKEKCSVFNVGTGTGTSVLEIIKIMEQETGKKLKYEFKGRRPGDLSCVYCDNKKIIQYLDWTPTRTIQDALKNYK